MMKKEYLQPGTEVLDIQLQPVMITISGENITSSDTPDDSDPNDPINDNRSRRTYNAWEDEEEEY